MAVVNSTSDVMPLTDGFVGLNTTMTSALGNTSSFVNVTEGMTLSSAAGASIVSPIVMFLAGFIGNVLALVVLHKTKTEIRSMMFYTLVAALTWNDLIGICLTSPPVLASYLNQRQMPALPTLCRFHALAMVCFGLSTPFIVCTMAIERSLALKCSYFYSKYCTPSSARLVVVILWAFVLFFGALPLLGVGSFTLQYPQTWCFLHFRSYVPVDIAYASAYAILNLLVIVVMIFCNGLVMTTLCRVRKSRRRGRRMSNSSSSGTLLRTEVVEEKAMMSHVVRRRHHRDVELQMIWLLCAITTIFSVCWAPLMMYILFCLQSPANSSPVFGLVAVRLASLNQTINPWIYVILRKSLLSRLARLCRHYRFSCRRSRDKPSEVSEPRRPTQYHNPPVYLHRKGGGGGGSGKNGTNLKNKYVHVGNQLCPSSQFVGYQELKMLSEGRGAKGKKSGSNSKSSKSREKQGGGSSSSSCYYGRWISETEQAVRDVSSGGVCSVCRDRLKSEGGVGDRGSCESRPSLAPPSLHSCSHSLLPVSGSPSGDHSLEETRHPHSLPVDGAYVDFFRHLPPSGVPLCTDVTLDDVSAATYRGQVCRGEGSETNVLSCISEADDHGYSSKMSTDSSRMSSPERSRPGPTHLSGSATNLEAETDFTEQADEAHRLILTTSDLLDKKGANNSVSEQNDSKNFQESHEMQQSRRNDVEDADSGVKEIRLSENDLNQKQSALLASARGDDAVSQDCGIKQSVHSSNVDQARTEPLTEKHTRNVKPNAEPSSKLNHCRRDDSLDFTSGVFDCRDDDDDDDDDDGNDDDVYDDNVESGPIGKEGRQKEGGERHSSSRTMSSSSAGTVVDSSSGHDNASVLYRHLSTSSAH